MKLKSAFFGLAALGGLATAGTASAMPLTQLRVSRRPLKSAALMAVSKPTPSTHMATCYTFARIPITPALFMTGVIGVSEQGA
jgi:hypothetical protein